MELTAQLKDLLSRLDEINTAEQRIKELNKEVQSLEAQIATRMQDEGIDSLKVDGIEFNPEIKQSFSLKGGLKYWDCEQFFKWLKDNGLGDIIKTTETVHHQTRTKVLKDWKSEGREFPDFIKAGFFTALKFNKSEVERRINNGTTSERN